MYYVIFAFGFQIFLMFGLFFLSFSKNRYIYYGVGLFLILGILLGCFLLYSNRVLIDVGSNELICAIIYIGLSFSIVTFAGYWLFDFFIRGIKKGVVTSKLICNSLLIGFSHVGLFGLLINFY